MGHIYTNIHSSCFTMLCSLPYQLLLLEVRRCASLQQRLRLTVVLSAFDQDINAKAAMAFPQLYIRGIRGLEYTRTKFWLYMLDGLYQSAVVYFIAFCAWTLGLAVSWNGKGIDSLADFGTTVSVAAIFTANTYVGINTR